MLFSATLDGSETTTTLDSVTQDEGSHSIELIVFPASQRTISCPYGTQWSIRTVIDLHRPLFTCEDSKIYFYIQ